MHSMNLRIYTDNLDQAQRVHHEIKEFVGADEDITINLFDMYEFKDMNKALTFNKQVLQDEGVIED